MRLRLRRRRLQMRRSPSSPPGRYVYTPLLQAARPGRVRWWIRTCALLSFIGLMRLARAVRTRWWPLLLPLLLGCALTAVGVALRHSAWGIVLLPGLVSLMSSAFLVPGSYEPRHARRSMLERELAAYATPAQRRDLETTLDRYPDGVTREHRDILARQAMTTEPQRIPGSGQH